jgi:hypothetical protein
MDGPPISQGIFLPEPEMVETVGLPLGPEFISAAQHMSAIIVGAIAAHSTENLNYQQVAAASVEIAMHIANEVRSYELRDGRAVKNG